MVELRVVRHVWQTAGPRIEASPHAVEARRGGGVGLSDAMDAHAGPVEILRLGLDEAVEGVDDAAVAHLHRSDGADAGGLVVGRLHVYGHEVSHRCRRILPQRRAPAP